MWETHEVAQIHHLYASGRMIERDAAVIGAGPAGLATAAMLRKNGVDAVVIDRAPEVGASWRGHYDRLRLHTVRWMSDLPGLRFPRHHGRWVPRDGVIEYLERYAVHHDLELMLGTDVRGLVRHNGGWLLSTSGEDVQAGQVVVATGYNNTPFMPDYPGKDSFEGDLVHASGYRNPEPYRDRDVLVVGSGNTGAEIAVDLVEGGARRVRLAVRTPPNIVRRQVGLTPNQVMAVALRNLPPKFVDSFVRVAQRVDDRRPDAIRAAEARARRVHAGDRGRRDPDHRRRADRLREGRSGGDRRCAARIRRPRGDPRRPRADTPGRRYRRHRATGGHSSRSWATFPECSARTASRP